MPPQTATDDGVVGTSAPSVIAGSTAPPVLPGTTTLPILAGTLAPAAVQATMPLQTATTAPPVIAGTTASPVIEGTTTLLDFVGNLAPGMKNRIRCVPISDEYGPPGQPLDSSVYPGLTNDFDALVLSHETLPTGRKLNVYSEGVLGLRPLKILCTQRTEPHGMSSTALRRMRTKQKNIE